MKKKMIIVFFLLVLYGAKGCGESGLNSSNLESAELMLNHARESYLNQNYGQAIKSYQLILDKFPDDYYENAWASYEIGICYYLLKNYVLARKYFVQVMQNYTVPKEVRILSLKMIRKIDYGDVRKRAFY